MVSYDKLLPASLNNKVYVHRWSPPNGNTLLVASLRANDAYENAATGLRVAVGAITGTTAVVSLDGYSPGSCVARAPLVTLTPVTSSVVSPMCSEPQTVGYQVRAPRACVPLRLQVAAIMIRRTRVCVPLAAIP